MSRFCQKFIAKLWTILFVGALAVGDGAFGTAAHAADAKPAWQIEWEKTVDGAKKEGQAAVYISGNEEILPEFQKDYPEIKVTAVIARGSQMAQRMIAERRADKSK